jgi:hypothetical protein
LLLFVYTTHESQFWIDLLVSLPHLSSLETPMFLLQLNLFTLLSVLFPSTGSSGNTLHYQWQLDSWSDLHPSLSSLFNACSLHCPLFTS